MKFSLGEINLRAFTPSFALFSTLACLSAFADVVDFNSVVIAGNSIIESANGNMSAGEISGAGGTPAVLAVSFAPATAGETITFNVISGEIGCCGSVSSFADGGTNSSANIASIGSLSGFIGPYSVPLTGVFTTSAAPSGAAPATLSYGTSDLQDASYSPLLNQVFFVGDGYTGNDTGSATQTGAQQVFDVPVGATQFFLGIEDACGFNGSPTGCYGDNPGSLTVNGQLNIPGSAVPEPGFVGAIAACLAGLGLLRRRA